MGIKGFVSLFTAILTAVLGLVGTALYNSLSPVEVAPPPIAIEKTLSALPFSAPSVNVAKKIEVKPEVSETNETKKIEVRAVAKPEVKPEPMPEVIKKEIAMRVEKIQPPKSEVEKRVFLAVKREDPQIGIVNNEELVEHYGFHASLPPIEVGALTTQLDRALANLNQTRLANVDKRPQSGSDTVKKVQSSIVERPAKPIQKAAPIKPIVVATTATAAPPPIKEVAVATTSPPIKPVVVATAASSPPPTPEKSVALSKSVLQAIDRELTRIPAPKNKPSDQIVPQIWPQAHQEILSSQNQLTLRSYTAVMEKEMAGQVFNFQFIPDYNRSETLSSNEEGVMTIQTVSHQQGTLRGRIISRGHMITLVNLPVGSRENDFEVPLVDEETFNERLQEMAEERKLNAHDIYGGFLLVQIPDGIEDVSIDQEYFSRIFLNQEFKKISREDDYSFVFFVGVNPGNTVLSYLLKEGDIAEKIVHIPLNEILYDIGDFEKSAYETVDLYQRNLFAQEKQELSLNEKDIQYFGGKTKFVAKGPNRFEFKRPAHIKGMNKYLKFQHLGSTIYAGYDKNTKIELPSRNFIENILDELNFNDLTNICIVQLNFPETPLLTEIDLNSKHLSNTVNLLYLDSEGTFSKAPTLKTQKAFVVSDAEGIFSGQVKYINGKIKNFNSFCSIETYLVEQL